jgi:hypothetical protein
MKSNGPFRIVQVIGFCVMAATSSISDATSPAPTQEQTNCGLGKLPPFLVMPCPSEAPQREFSCSAKTLDLSREEIEKIAFAEFQRRGGVLRRGEFETKLKRYGCDWWVAVSLLPPRPGGHFTVVVDGLTGNVKTYIPGA